MKGTWPLLREEPGRLISLALVLVPFGLLLSPCLVGVPVLGFALGELARTTLRAAWKSHGHNAPAPAAKNESFAGWAGALAVLGLVLISSATLLPSMSVAVAFDTAGVAPQLFVALVAAASTGAALAPFALAPLAAADGSRGLFPPLGRSLELTAPLGARRLASIGAAAGAGAGSSIFVAASLIAEAPNPVAAFALAFAFGPIAAFAVALLARAYVALASEPAPSSTPVSRSLLAPALLLSPMLVLPLGVATIAALTPTSMPLLDEPVALQHGFHEPRPTLPGTPLSVRKRTDGIEVETHDGGGAGRIRAPFAAHLGVLFIENGEPYGGAPGTFAIIATNGSQSAYTLVDREGVRQDDGLDARVLGRLGPFGGGALALGLALFLLLAYRLGVDLGQARTLGAPALNAPGAGPRRGLEGILRLGEGVQLEQNRRSIRAAGEAWIEADDGALRVALPTTPVPILGDAAPKAGQPVVLVSRFARPLTTNLRQASAPWPGDGLLILGTRADASGALTRRASTVAAWIALPAVPCLLIACAAVLLAL